jgi:hypothetical protein
MLTDTIKAAYLEELRFAKRQQWQVAIAAITLIAGAFYLVDKAKQPLALWQISVITFLIAVVAAGGCCLLWKLQLHLQDTRLVIDTFDRNAFWRGSEVAIGLAAALIISAVVVGCLLLGPYLISPVYMRHLNNY